MTIVLLNPFMHAPFRFADAYFAAFIRNLIHYSILPVGGSLGRTKCDLSVVSDLKTDPTSCCCRQRRSGSDKPLMYGRTAVDLILVAGSISEMRAGSWIL